MKEFLPKSAAKMADCLMKREALWPADQPLEL